MRDLVVHGDDLVIATYGRAFWVLDDITPLRQIAAGTNAGKVKLFAPAVAVRVDNDSFLGSPFPPEEPLAKNPPNGAMIDYYLPAKADKVTLEVVDAKGRFVRRYVSGEKKEEKLPPVPIAERWLSKPVSWRQARACIALCGTCVGTVPAQAKSSKRTNTVRHAGRVLLLRFTKSS